MAGSGRGAAGPPDSVPPGKLFRLLSTRKRPRLPIAYRFPLAPNVPLHVRALRAAEHAAAWSAESRDLLVMASQAASAEVACALWTDDGPAFSDASELGQLTTSELDSLSRAVADGLAIVSPIYGASDGESWHETLRAGALLPPNLTTAMLMRDCADVAVGFGGIVRSPRPDRYYGRPLCKLTDGQLMAYRAACSAIDSIRGE